MTVHRHTNYLSSRPVRLLTLPIVFLLAAGLGGCTSTRWTVVDPPESQAKYRRVKVTLTSGFQLELYNAVLTDELISGMTKNDRPFTESLDKVRKIEVDTGVDKKSFRWAYVVVPTVVVIIAVILFPDLYGPNCSLILRCN